MDPLSPRLTIPFTDEEILRLYGEARARLGDEPAPDPFAMESGQVICLGIDSILATVLFITVVSPAANSTLLALLGSMALGLILPTACLVLGRQLGGLCVGPLGLAWLWRESRLKVETVNPNDPEVLALVIGHVSDTPIERSRILRTEISDQRSQIGDTLAELPPLIEAFDRELGMADNEDLRLILASRRDAAGRAESRLREVDEQLEDQFEQAEAAVQPLVRIRDQFQRYRNLSQSLSRIQAAHDLAATGEEKVIENRLELRALYASSLAAQARLAEIQSVMESTERAREEVRQLMA